MHTYEHVCWLNMGRGVDLFFPDKEISPYYHDFLFYLRNSIGVHKVLISLFRLFLLFISGSEIQTKKSDES